MITSQNRGKKKSVAKSKFSNIFQKKILLKKVFGEKNSPHFDIVFNFGIVFLPTFSHFEQFSTNVLPIRVK